MTLPAEHHSFRLTARVWNAIAGIYDSSRHNLILARAQFPDRIDWARSVPFLLMQLACLAAFLTGVSPFAIGVAVAAYLVRMFAITGFYYRYFLHRSL